MIKYKTSQWHELIEEVTVLKETNTQIVIEIIYPTGVKFESRYAKKSKFRNYFGTWEEAHGYLLNRQTSRVKKLRVELQKAIDTYNSIKRMKAEKQPEPTNRKETPKVSMVPGTVYDKDWQK